MLQTERCTIRPFKEGDISGFMEYRNDEHWMRYQGFKGLTRRAYERELLGIRPMADGKQLAVVETATGCLLGDIYLRQERDAYWLGYTISPGKARQGYAYEAAGAAIGWIREQGVHKIFAGVLPENTASVKLLEKLGFVYTNMCEGEEMIYVLSV